MRSICLPLAIVLLAAAPAAAQEVEAPAEPRIEGVEQLDRLERRRRLGTLHPVQIVSVTGGTVAAEYGIARRIAIGGAGIRNLPVAFADVTPFRQLDLIDRPAILLGMDALQLFDRVSFDFANRRVRLLLPQTSRLAREVRLSALGRPRRKYLSRKQDIW